MKFKNFLNEAKADREDIEQLVDDCMPFIKDLAENDFWYLYSGRGSANKEIIKRKVRKNRKPVDTPEFIHNLLDDAFKKEFGVKARSQSIFVTTNEEDASSYGMPYFVFPVGRKYAFIYSELVPDLYNLLTNRITSRMENYYNIEALKMGIKGLAQRFYKMGLDTIYYNKALGEIVTKKQDDDKRLYKEITKKEFENIAKQEVESVVDNYEISKRFRDALNEDVEIMLVCDEVWLLRVSYFNETILEEVIKEKL